MKPLRLSSTLAGLSLIGLFSLPGCASMGGTDLLGTLQKTAGLATQITNWQGNLSGMLNEAQLKHVDNFAAQASSLSGSLGKLTEGTSLTSGMQSVTDLLGQISNFKTSDLVGMAGDERVRQVKQLGQLGQSLNDTVGAEIKNLQSMTDGTK